MSYILEISINHKKIANKTETQDNLIALANSFCCESYYNKYEFSGRHRTVQYYNNVYTFHFPENIETICGFIRSVKQSKGIYIESIGFDNVVYDLIYASKKYLNIMEKENVNNYIQRRESGEIFSKNPEILSLVSKN